MPALYYTPRAGEEWTSSLNGSLVHIPCVDFMLETWLRPLVVFRTCPGLRPPQEGQNREFHDPLTTAHF